MGFAKLPVLSVHPESVDYVPLHTLKDHPLWNVLNNDEYFRTGTNLVQKKDKGSFFKLIVDFLLIKTKKSFRRQLF